MSDVERDQRRFLAAWCNSFGRPSREMYQGVREKYEFAASGADWDDSAPILRNDHPWRGKSRPHSVPRRYAPPLRPTNAALQLPAPPRLAWWRRAFAWVTTCFRRK